MQKTATSQSTREARSLIRKQIYTILALQYLKHIFPEELHKIQTTISNDHFPHFLRIPTNYLKNDYKLMSSYTFLENE